MQRFRVGTLRNIPRVSCIEQVCITRKYQVTSGVFRVIPRESVAYIFYFLSKKIRWPTTQSMMRSVDVIPSNIQRLSCNLIGCIFYAMVEKFVFLHVSVSISNDTLDFPLIRSFLWIEITLT